MKGIVIRRGEERDVQSIADNNIQIAKESENRDLNPSTAREGVFSVLRNESHGFYLLAEKNSRIIGQMMITFEWSDWSNGLYWWIQSVFVEPGSRKQGVFRALYRHLSELAESTGGVCGLKLYAHQSNRKAMQTYLAVGMKQSPYVLFEKER